MNFTDENFVLQMKMTFEEKQIRAKFLNFKKWFLFLWGFVYLDEHYYLTARFPLKVLTAGVAAVMAL